MSEQDFHDDNDDPAPPGEPFAALGPKPDANANGSGSPEPSARPGQGGASRLHGAASGAALDALLTSPLQPENRRPADGRPADDRAMTRSAHQELMQLLKERSGTDFSHYKPSTIQRRLQKRISALQQPDIEAYLEQVRRHPLELDELYRSLLISVTGFFRDADVFAALERELASLIAAKLPGESLRVWVPGCATGEEAYSIALLLQRLGHYSVQIFATDIDEHAIASARRGIYPESSLEKLPAELRAAYFTRLGDGDWELSKAIRNLVLFSRHDLTVNPPFLKLDLISCRNLLIYFGASLQKQILPLFHYALHPEGLLLLGKSESIGPFTDLFSPKDSPQKLFRRRPGSAVHPSHYQGLRQPAGRPAPGPGGDWGLDEHVRERLYQAYPHPYVLLNERLEVLQVHGEVSGLLSLAQGRMSTQLLKLCRPELQVELRALLASAQRTCQPRLGCWRRWPPEAAHLLLRPCVYPLGPERPELTLVFEQIETQALPWLQPASGRASAARLAELEQELALARSQTQVIYEEFEAANQELQALNEELQAANEELETSNEELQAANEELQVAYSELQPIGIIGLARGISQKQRLQDVLRARQESFKPRPGSSADGILVAAADGRPGQGATFAVYFKQARACALHRASPPPPAAERAAEPS